MLNLEGLFSFLTENIGLIALSAWLLLSLSNANRRSDFLENTYRLVSNPSGIQNYSEEWLRRFETSFHTALTSPIANANRVIINLIIDTWQTYNWKLIGQFFLLLAIPLFFISDAIVITNSLEVLNYPVENLSAGLRSIFSQYGIAIAVGSFLSVIVGAFVFMEVYGDSKFADFHEYEGKSGILLRISAWVALVLGLFIGIALGIPPLSNVEVIPAWANTIVGYSLNLGIRATVLFCSAAIFRESLKGFRMIGLFLLCCVWILGNLLFYGANLAGTLGRFALDLFGRLFRWLILLLAFLFSPLDSFVTYAHQKLGKDQTDFAKTQG